MFNNSYQQYAAATVRIVQSQQVTDHWENFLSSDGKRKQMCSLVRSNCEMGHVWHFMQFADLLAALAFAFNLLGESWENSGKLGKIGLLPILQEEKVTTCSTTRCPPPRKRIRLFSAAELPFLALVTGCAEGCCAVYNGRTSFAA